MAEICGVDLSGLLAARQRSVDNARLLNHRLGYRPYRVRLVWQVQNNTTGKWGSDQAAGGLEIELLPVTVRGIMELDQIVEQSGRHDSGIVSLYEISPLQVDEATLLGWRDGQPWAEGYPRREFFYEIDFASPVTPPPRCPGQGPAETKRRRMIPAGAPELRMDNHEWRVRLTDQFGERTAGGVDQTVPGGFVTVPPSFTP